MKRILVALDRSSRASAVLSRGEAIARATGAELYLFHAVGLPDGLPAEAFRSSPDDVVYQLRMDAALNLERRAASLDPSVVVHVVVRIGQPWSAICQAAREHDVDLVVIGSHGYDALDHVIGTTAAKVVDHSERSVLLVREGRSSVLGASDAP